MGEEVLFDREGSAAILEEVHVNRLGIPPKLSVSLFSKPWGWPGLRLAPARHPDGPVQRGVPHSPRC